MGGSGPRSPSCSAELESCDGAGCRARPRLKLNLVYDADRVHGRDCTTSGVEVTIGGADAGEAVSAHVRGPGKATDDTRRPLRIRISRDALKQGADSPIAAEVAVLDGRIETVSNSVPRVCG